MANLYLFIGQSGSGKGTQATLLKEKLMKLDPSVTPFYIETGHKFRDMIAADTATAIRTRALIAEGKLPPSFLGVHSWSHELILNYDGVSPIILDGTPRVADEVPLLLSAFRFYGWEVHVLGISVTDEWAYERIRGRGRADDQEEHDIMGRINWFHESVEPAIALLRGMLYTVLLFLNSMDLKLRETNL